MLPMYSISRLLGTASLTLAADKLPDASSDAWVRELLVTLIPLDKDVGLQLVTRTAGLGVLRRRHLKKQVRSGKPSHRSELVTVLEKPIDAL